MTDNEQWNKKIDKRRTETGNKEADTKERNTCLEGRNTDARERTPRTENKKENNNSEDKAQENHQKMTETPVPSLILKLSGSTIFSMLAGTTYNLVDMYFVSDLGNRAVAAVGVMFSVLAMIQAVGYTFGMGAGSRISRYLGDKKEEEASFQATVAVCISFVLGLLLMGGGFLWEKHLVDFLGATETIRDFAMDYGFWILLTSPVMCVSYVLNNVLRSEGMPVWALAGIGSGAILNILLDFIFVSIFEMGIKGAGLATFCGQSVSLVIMLVVLISRKSVVRLRLFHPSGEKQRFWQEAIAITRTGIPSFFRQGLVCVATILLNRAARTYGDGVVAAISVSNKVFAVIFAVMVGYGQGFAPVVGYNYGAKAYDRVKKSITFTMISQIVAAVLAGGLVWVFAPSIIALFGENSAEEIGVLSLRMHAVSLPLMPLCLITGMLFQAVGQIKKAVVLSSARQGIFFLPLIFLLPLYFQEQGVAVTQGIADILAGVFSLPFFLWYLRTLKKEESDGTN